MEGCSGILHVIRPAAGGMKRHLVSLAAHTASRGVPVAVACPAKGAIRAEVEDAGIITLPLNLHGQVTPINDWLAVLQLTSHLRRGGYALVHAHGTKAALITRPAALLAGTRAVIYTVHNSIYFPGLPGWQQQAMAAAERLLARKTDRIIAVSEDLRRELLDRTGLDPGLVITIPNGIEVPAKIPSGSTVPFRRRLNLPPLGRLVGTVARLAPQKGLADFLSAAAMLCPNASTSFVVAGDGPLRESLESKAHTLGLSGRVFFLGHLADVPSLLRALDIFVLPSLTEGFPLSLLEAMAAGLPVVATRVGGIPEIVNHGATGLLVPSGSPKDLAGAILELLANHDLAAAMGQAGRHRAAHSFSLDTMVDKTLEQYQQILVRKASDRYRLNNRLQPD